MKAHRLFAALTIVIISTIGLLGTAIVFTSAQKYLKPEYINEFSLNFLLLFLAIGSPLIFGMIFLGMRVIKKSELERTAFEFSHQSRMAGIGQMLGGVAHEINNPLTIYMARTDFLLDQIRNNQYTSKSLEESVLKNREIIKRIVTIVNGMRALSRNDNEDAFELTSIKNIICLTTDMCKEPLENRNIELIVSEYDETLLIDCRAVQLSQVLLNLINNASDAIKDFEGNRWIKLRIESSENDIKFEVLNSGPKISDFVSKKLFSPFFTTKPVGQGSGMGLTISQKIIESHCGKISIDSKCEQTCFVINLPLKQEIHIKKVA